MFLEYLFILLSYWVVTAAVVESILAASIIRCKNILSDVSRAVYV